MTRKTEQVGVGTGDAFTDLSFTNADERCIGCCRKGSHPTTLRNAQDPAFTFPPACCCLIQSAICRVTSASIP
jgi:hypothetical protein